MAGNLLAKLPNLPNRSTNNFDSYYKKLATKAVGIDQIPGKLLENGLQLLIKAISELCNVAVAVGSFPDACRIAKVKPPFKKGSKICQVSICQVIDKYLCYLCYLKSLKDCSRSNKKLQKF